jgi:hypothetical protein
METLISAISVSFIIYSRVLNIPRFEAELLASSLNKYGTTALTEKTFRLLAQRSPDNVWSITTLYQLRHTGDKG